MTGKVVILGGSGRFGRHASEAFWNAGWRVVGYDRGRDDLLEAARGADVIVNGWNPAYDAWAREVPALTARVIEAARTSGATVIVPGNVYVFSDGAPETLGPDTPHAARNPLGRIRVEMERAYRQSGVQTIVLRAGDFIDTEASGNWFDLVLTKQLGRGRFVYPGDPDVPHAWAYLPDMAAAAVALAERRQWLDRVTDVPFPGYTLTGRELHALLVSVTGHDLRLSRMNWLPLRLLSLAVPKFRGVVEMRYLWDMPHRLDPAVLGSLLPGFRPTLPEVALARAIEHQIGPDKAMPRPALAAG